MTSTVNELTRAEESYLTIRDKLVLLDIRPGAPIRELQLADELGTGRTPVREALKRLEHERLVVTYPRRGTFATDVNITDLTDIGDVRRLLEPPAAGFAATNATAAQRDQLRALNDELHQLSRDTTAHEDLMRVDLQVHRAVYAATGNPYLADTLERYDNLATRIWCLYLDRLPTMAGHVTEHHRLLSAIVAGDAATATHASREHIDHFESAIRQVI